MRLKAKDELPKTVCKKEVAEALGVCYRTVEHMIARGEIPPPHRITGGTLRWTVEEVNVWLNKVPRRKPNSP